MQRFKSILSVFSGGTCAALKTVILLNTDHLVYCGMSCNLVAEVINEGFVPEGAFLTDRASLPG